MKDKHEKLVTSTNNLKVSSKPKKAEKPQKINISSNDGAKYMSYVKVRFFSVLDISFANVASNMSCTMFFPTCSHVLL